MGRGRDPLCIIVVPLSCPVLPLSSPTLCMQAEKEAQIVAMDTDKLHPLLARCPPACDAPVPTPGAPLPAQHDRACDARVPHHCAT